MGHDSLCKMTSRLRHTFLNEQLNAKVVAEACIVVKNIAALASFPPFRSHRQLSQTYVPFRSLPFNTRLTSDITQKGQVIDILSGFSAA